MCPILQSEWLVPGGGYANAGSKTHGGRNLIEQRQKRRHPRQQAENGTQQQQVQQQKTQRTLEDLRCRRQKMGRKNVQVQCSGSGAGERKCEI